MLVACILLIVFTTLLIIGLKLTNFVFGRRPIPDALDPEVLKNTDWVKYEPNISNAAAWLKEQPHLMVLP